MMDERPPRLAWAMWKRFLLGAAVVVALSASATATAGFLQIDEVVQVFREEANILNVPEVTRADAGEPQTLLVLGSDRRFVDIRQKNPARSDTIILVRLDPDKDATTVLSIPRDLKVDMRRGNGTIVTDKINAAYALGGPRLTTRVVRDLLGIDINHVINVNFGGFRRAVDRIGCVYVDIDRRYFNDNSGFGPDYATIDIKPGYQKLCGQDALDFVRYRHEDTDLVRAARQQEFLRQAKDQVGAGELFGDREALVRIFARYTDADKTLRSTKQVLRLIKLAIFSRGNPIREVHFRSALGETYVEATPEQIRRTVREFLSATASKGARGKLRPTSAEKKVARRRKRKPEVVAGLIEARREGEDQAIYAATRKLGFPAYYPTLRTQYATYYPQPRTYDLYDADGKKHRAYRIVSKAGIVGEYYGVQGTNWKDPPILADPSEKRRMRGRTYELFYDGSRLRVVAFRTEHAVYWVSNTLLRTISNKQMLAIARSLRRLGDG